jgi:P27 family predicted phage terminase small subunit
MRGRKRKPTALKLVAGRTGKKATTINAGKRKLPENEPKIDAAIPTCPKHLNAEERDLWAEIGKELYDLGVLTNVDAGVFEVYVTALAIMRRVKPEIEKSLVFDGPNGGPIQNPYLAIYNKAKEHVMKAGAELGVSPASRSRVSVKKQKESADPFEEFEKEA